MIGKSTWLMVAVALCTCLGACGWSLDDEVYEWEPCEGKCDSMGPLELSATWVPSGGFVKVMLAEKYGFVVEPAEGAVIEDHGKLRMVRFSRNGFYWIRALEGDRLIGEAGVRVADDGPDFRIDTPEAGEFLTIDPARRYPVRIVGGIHDALGESVTATIHLEGVGRYPLALDGKGSFDVSVPAVFGVNFVDLEAFDAAGNVFRYSHAFMAAEAYDGQPGRTAVTLDPDGLAFLASTLNKILPEIVRIVGKDEPIERALGHDVYFYGGTIPGQDGNPGTSTLDLSTVGDRLRIDLHLNGTSIFRGKLDGWLSGGDFTVEVDNASVEVLVGFQSTGDGVVGVAYSVTVNENGVDFSVSDLPGWFTGLFEGRVRGAMEDAAVSQVAPLVQKGLEGVQGAMEINFPVMNHTVPMTLAYNLVDLTPHDGGITLGLEAVADCIEEKKHGPGEPIMPTSRFTAPTEGNDVAMAIGFNMLNQFLFEAWQGGTMEFYFDQEDLRDLLTHLPGEGSYDNVVALFGKLELPPVVHREADGNLVFSIGELRLDGFFATDIYQFTLDGNLGARMNIDIGVGEDGGLSVIPDLREVRIDIGRSGYAGLNPEAIEEIMRVAAPAIVTAVARRIESYHLPAFDMGNVGMPGVKLGGVFSSGSCAADSCTLAGDLVEFPADTE